MTISRNWLNLFLNTSLTTKELAKILTDIGLETENIQPYLSHAESLKTVLIVEVLKVFPHENADKLKVTEVTDGNQTYQVVCGAPNVAEGQKVALATMGTTLLVQGKSITIQKANIRGVSSEGMLCSEKELGISENHDGIWELPDEAPLGKSIWEYLNAYSDEVLEIGLTPNRADAMSHHGVARDVYAAAKFRGLPVEWNEHLKGTSLEVKDRISEITIINEVPELCFRYAALVVENVAPIPSPEWMQNFLNAIGLQPINHLVDVTNFVQHHLGQPLHAFDKNKISGNTIRVGVLPKNSEIVTLDGVTRKLNGEEIIIKDGKNQPLAIGGVFGGKESGVTEKTTSIVLESAYFKPSSIRKTAKYHQLSTDASFRFERGVNIEMVIPALELAAALIKEQQPEAKFSWVVDDYPTQISSHAVEFRLAKVEEILGIRLDKDVIAAILELLDIQIIKTSEDIWKLIIPSYRNDVTREIDVIEEILRIYGYESISEPEEFCFAIPKTSTSEKLSQYAVGKFLTHRGFFEVMNLSLVPDDQINSSISLLNPLSNDLSTMRTDLLHGLLETAVFNYNRKREFIPIFEWGKVFIKEENQFTEKTLLGILISGTKNYSDWTTPPQKNHFFFLKSCVENILVLLNRKDIEETIIQTNNGAGVQFTCSGKTLASILELSKDVLKKYDLSSSVAYAWLDWEIIQEIKETQFQLKSIPKFPKVERDLALVVDEIVSFTDIKKLVLQFDSRIQEVQLFDVYQGDKIPAGKKSYAIRFTIQDESKTLNDSEIDVIFNGLIKQAKNQLNASLR